MEISFISVTVGVFGRVAKTFTKILIVLEIRGKIETNKKSILIDKTGQSSRD